VKVLVGIKRVIDYNVKIRVKADGSGVETNNVKMSINPFDEIAVEEALRLKERGIATEVVVVSLGPAAAVETIRHALALGADRGIHIDMPESPEPLGVAKALKAVAANEQPQLILLGKQAIDDDSNQVGQMLSALLDWPQSTFVSALTIENGKCKAVREVDGGLETLILPLPAVISTDLRLNTPRYATLPNIMKAKQKPIQQLTAGELGLSLKSHTKILKVSEPPARKGGVVVSSVAELVAHINNIPLERSAS
jgi:electron transfer flavoprotein beta subunit